MIRIIVKNITLLCILASSPGLKHIRAEHPDLEVLVFVLSQFLTPSCFCLEIWVAGVDPGLTDKGIITPGLGDAVRLSICACIWLT